MFDIVFSLILQFIEFLPDYALLVLIVSVIGSFVFNKR